jgi:DNA-binding LacI/PurR family transcriptional regulator
MKRPARIQSPHPPGATTIREVAAEAGVSTATVSRVLGGMNGVTVELRERVRGAAAKLIYYPNRLARGLRVGQRKVIGVIIPDLRNPFFTGVAHGVEGALYKAGYTLQLGNSDGQPEREQAQLGILRGEGVAGLVFIAGNRPAANYDVLRSWDIPVVAVDRSPGGLEVDLVHSNNREGMRQAVLHLLALGYPEVAIVTGPAGIDVAEERLGGYRDALRSAGRPVREELIIHSDFRQEGGQAAMARLLDLAQPPRAVVVANNLMTLGALEVSDERHVRIPEDLALVGFDDMPWATLIRPPLTAVAQSAEELGRVAAQLLLERLEDPSRVVRQVVLPTRLMVRASCGARAAGPAAPPRQPAGGGQAAVEAASRGGKNPSAAAIVNSPLGVLVSPRHQPRSPARM